MLPRAQKGHKFPRPFVQRRLLFSDEKKGSKFTTFSPPRHCEWRIATASRSPLGFFRFLFSVPFIVSRIFPLSFFFISFSFPSPSLFSSIQDRSQTRDIRIDNARQCGNQQPFTVPLFWLKRVTCQNIGYCRGWDALWVTLTAGPRGDGLFSWPGRREKWSGETNSRVTLSSLSSSSLLEAWLMTMRETGDEPSPRN